jgi:hypothetical protein
MGEKPAPVNLEAKPRSHELPPFQVMAWTESGLPISRNDFVFRVGNNNFVGMEIFQQYDAAAIVKAMNQDGMLGLHQTQEVFGNNESYFEFSERSRVVNVKDKDMVKFFSDGFSYQVRFWDTDNQGKLDAYLLVDWAGRVDKRVSARLSENTPTRLYDEEVGTKSVRDEYVFAKLERTQQGWDIVLLGLTLKKTNSPTEEQKQLKKTLEENYKEWEQRTRAVMPKYKDEGVHRDSEQETESWSPKSLENLATKEEITYWEEKVKEILKENGNWKQQKENFDKSSLVFIEAKRGGTGDAVYMYLLTVQLAKLYPKKEFCFVFPPNESSAVYTDICKGVDCPQNISFLEYQEIEKKLLWKKVKAFFTRSKTDVAYINLHDELTPKAFDFPQKVLGAIQLHPISFSDKESQQETDFFDRLPESLRSQWLSLPLMVNAMLGSAIPYPLPVEGFKELPPKVESKDAGYDVVFVYDAFAYGRSKVLSLNQLLESVAFCQKLNLKVGIVIGKTNPNEADIVKKAFPSIDLIKGSINEISDILCTSKVVVTVDTGFGHIVQARILASRANRSTAENKTMRVPRMLSLFGKLGFDPHRFFLPLAKTILGSKIAAQINQNKLNSSIEEAHREYLAEYGEGQ